MEGNESELLSYSGMRGKFVQIMCFNISFLGFNKRVRFVISFPFCTF